MKQTIYNKDGVDLRDFINYTDPLTLNYLANAKYLAGVFQLNSKVSAVAVSRRFQEMLDHKHLSLDTPKEEIIDTLLPIIINKGLTRAMVIGAISDCTTLIRPSAQDSGAYESYFERLKGKVKSTHINKKSPFFDLFERFTKLTQLEILYQEQIMEILSDCLSISAGKADTYRRAFEKGDEKLLQKIKIEFYQKWKNKSTTEEMKEFWEYLVSASGYLFNKSHAVSYSFITYQTVYIKVYIIFMIASGLAEYLHNNDKKILFLNEAKENDIKISLPRINNVYLDPTAVMEENKIYLALSNIKHIGEVVALKLVDKTFDSLDEFADYASRNGLNKSIIKILIEIDFFAVYNQSKEYLRAYFNSYYQRDIEDREKKFIKKYNGFIYKLKKDEELYEDGEQSCKVIVKKKKWEIEPLRVFNYTNNDIITYLLEYHYLEVPLLDLSQTFSQCTLFEEFDMGLVELGYNKQEDCTKEIIVVKSVDNRSMVGKNGKPFNFSLIRDLGDNSYFYSRQLQISKGSILSMIIKETPKGKNIVTLRVIGEINEEDLVLK